MFFNPQLFLSGFKNFSVHTSRIQIEFACLHASDGIQIHSRETRPTRCPTILVYCSVRDWTRFCYVIGFENIGIHRPRVIGFVADLFSSTLDSRLKNIWFAAEFAGCVWTEAVSGKKKLRIQKYLDTCGRGLRLSSLRTFSFYFHFIVGQH